MLGLRHARIWVFHRCMLGVVLTPVEQRARASWFSFISERQLLPSLDASDPGERRYLRRTFSWTRGSRAETLREALQENTHLLLMTTDYLTVFFPPRPFKTFLFFSANFSSNSEDVCEITLDPFCPTKMATVPR